MRMRRSFSIELAMFSALAMVALAPHLAAQGTTRSPTFPNGSSASAIPSLEAGIDPPAASGLPVTPRSVVPGGGFNQGAWQQVPVNWFPALSVPEENGNQPDPLAAASFQNGGGGPLQPVPEPETIVLFTIGAMAAGWLLWSRRSAFLRGIAPIGR